MSWVLIFQGEACLVSQHCHLLRTEVRVRFDGSLPPCFQVFQNIVVYSCDVWWLIFSGLGQNFEKFSWDFLHQLWQNHRCFKLQYKTFQVGLFHYFVLHLKFAHKNGISSKDKTSQKWKRLQLGLGQQCKHHSLKSRCCYWNFLNKEGSTECGSDEISREGFTVVWHSFWFAVDVDDNCRDNGGKEDEPCHSPHELYIKVRA